MADHLPRSAWKRYSLKEGSRGPLRANFAFLRLVRVQDKLPGERLWVIVRRSLSQPPETKYYISNAPAACDPATFVWLSGMRWPIETRTWQGWHHHLAQTFAAQKTTATHCTTSCQPFIITNSEIMRLTVLTANTRSPSIAAQP